jgi:hypothetical protein
MYNVQLIPKMPHRRFSIHVWSKGSRYITVEYTANGIFLAVFWQLKRVKDAANLLSGTMLNEIWLQT